jgi:hypothetical protein
MVSLCTSNYVCLKMDRTKIIIYLPYLKKTPLPGETPPPKDLFLVIEKGVLDPIHPPL